MKTLVLSSVLGIIMAGTAFAASNTGLSAPIVQCTGVIAKNVEALELDDAQQVILKDWLATMPAVRKEAEAKAVAMRADLTKAILTGAPTEERQALADKIGGAETDLLMMRSGCADHWRGVLSEEQFAKMLELAAAK